MDKLLPVSATLGSFVPTEDGHLIMSINVSAGNSSRVDEIVSDADGKMVTIDGAPTLDPAVLVLAKAAVTFANQAIAAMPALADLLTKP